MTSNIPSWCCSPSGKGEEKNFSSTYRESAGFTATLLPYRGTGIAFVTEIIKPIHKARTCTTMQHLRLSTSRPIRPLPHSRQWTNVLPVSGPSLFGGIVPEGFAFSVTPTTADTLEGCTVGVNQGQSGKGTGGPSPRNGPGGPDAGGRQPRSILDALPPSLERVLSRAVICHQMPCFAPPAGRIPSPRRLALGRKVWKDPRALGAVVVRRRSQRVLGVWPPSFAAGGRPVPTPSPE